MKLGELFVEKTYDLRNVLLRQLYCGSYSYYVLGQVDCSKFQCISIENFCKNSTLNRRGNAPLSVASLGKTTLAELTALLDKDLNKWSYCSFDTAKESLEALLSPHLHKFVDFGPNAQTVDLKDCAFKMGNKVIVPCNLSGQTVCVSLSASYNRTPMNFWSGSPVTLDLGKTTKDDCHKLLGTDWQSFEVIRGRCNIYGELAKEATSLSIPF